MAIGDWGLGIGDWGLGIGHLMDAIKAVSVKLTEEEIKYLEEPYQPHNVVGALKREQQK